MSCRFCLPYTVEATKSEHDCPPATNQRKKENENEQEPPNIHFPTFWSVLHTDIYTYIYIYILFISSISNPMAIQLYKWPRCTAFAMTPAPMRQWRAQPRRPVLSHITTFWLLLYRNLEPYCLVYIHILVILKHFLKSNLARAL